MVSRENRVILASLVLVGLTVVGLVLAPIDTANPLPVWLVVAGVGIAAPQLYLAFAVEDDVPARTRVRTAALGACVYGFGLLANADPPEQRLIGGAVTAVFVGLLAYEVLAGYRSATA